MIRSRTTPLRMSVLSLTYIVIVVVGNKVDLEKEGVRYEVAK